MITKLKQNESIRICRYPSIIMKQFSMYTFYESNRAILSRILVDVHDSELDVMFSSMVY